MNLDEAIKHCEEEADILAGSECGLDHAQLASWLKDYKHMREVRGQSEKVPEEKMWGMTLSIALRNMELGHGMVKQLLQQMKVGMDNVEKDSPEYFRIVYLLTLVGGAEYMLDGIDGILNALVLNMIKDVEVK